MNPRLACCLLECLRAPCAALGRPVPRRVFDVLGRQTTERAWQRLPRRWRTFQDLMTGCWMTADLGDWLERRHYFCGYPDVANALLIQRWLRPGDSFLDVGAHRGVHTLFAARQTSPRGRVVAIEPQSRMHRRLRTHLELNQIDGVETRRLALGEKTERRRLGLPLSGHSGQATLRVTEGAGGNVPVRRADDLFAPEDFPGRLLIKIDVEGWEFAVLRGMKRLLARPNTVLSLEVTPAWIQQHGDSIAGLLNFLRLHGYRHDFLLTTGRGGRERLALRPLADATAWPQYDMVASRPGEGPHTAAPKSQRPAPLSG